MTLISFSYFVLSTNVFIAVLYVFIPPFFFINKATPG